MKKTIYVLLGCLLSAAAMAETYDVTANWTPVSLTNAGATLTYDLQYRVNVGPDTQVDNIPADTWAGQITANPGDSIEVRVRSDEELSGDTVNSAWTTYASATGGVCLVVPSVPGALNINVQCQ